MTPSPTRGQQRPVGAGTDAHRALMPAQRQPGQPYLRAMVSTSDVDNREWAAVVDSILNERGLTPSTAAELVGREVADARTIRRWRNAEVGVSATKVRDFCRALGISPLHGLVKVGFLRPDEIGAGFAAAAGRVVDRLIRILDETLADPRIPSPARRLLRLAVQATYDDWLNTQAGPPGPREPKMRNH